MTVPRRVRVAPLLLTLLLVAGPLAAAAHRPQEAWQSRVSFTGFLSEAWALMSQIWRREGGSIDPFGKEGSGIDPFGKEGSGVDPFGKAGGSTDPFGNPAPNAQPSSNNISSEGDPSGR
jgi:hypothetical protein